MLRAHCQDCRVLPYFITTPADLSTLNRPSPAPRYTPRGRSAPRATGGTGDPPGNNTIRQVMADTLYDIHAITRSTACFVCKDPGHKAYECPNLTTILEDPFQRRHLLMLLNRGSADTTAPIRSDDNDMDNNPSINAIVRDAPLDTQFALPAPASLDNNTPTFTDSDLTSLLPSPVEVPTADLLGLPTDATRPTSNVSPPDF